jgi:hypothetical protein
MVKLETVQEVDTLRQTDTLWELSQAELDGIAGSQGGHEIENMFNNINNNNSGTLDENLGALHNIIKTGIVVIWVGN